QTEIATQELERALGHLEGGIGKVQEHFKSVLRQVAGDSAEAKANVATVMKAQEIEILHLDNEFRQKLAQEAQAAVRELTEFQIRQQQQLAELSKQLLIGLPEESVALTELVEQKKLDIQISYLNKATEARKKQIDQDTNDLIAREKQRLTLGAITQK